jgi:hypothetical protein
MSRVIELNSELVLQLSTWEKIGGLHSNPKADVDSLVSVTSSQNPWSKEVLKGVRAPGTGIPYVILLGSMRYSGGKDFTAIYGKGPVDIYEFSSGEFKRWIVSQKYQLTK